VSTGAGARRGVQHHEAIVGQQPDKATKENFLPKIISHEDGSTRIGELVHYHRHDVTVKGAWTGPAALSLIPRAMAPVAAPPGREVLGARHIVADLTCGEGEVAVDCLG